jgi:DNA-binding response OmpR family regulator
LEDGWRALTDAPTVKRDPTERPTFEEVLQAPLKDYQHRETSGDTDIHFGQFCALPLSRQLLPDGTPVELGGRAFDLFMVLVAAKGSVVGKEEIMRRVSPSTVVGKAICESKWRDSGKRSELTPM